MCNIHITAHLDCPLHGEVACYPAGLNTFFSIKCEMQLVCRLYAAILICPGFWATKRQQKPFTAWSTGNWFMHAGYARPFTSLQTEYYCTTDGMAWYASL